MAAEQPNQDGDGDVAILFPSRTADIGGRAVTMREYTFAETLTHAAPIAALVEAMTPVMLSGRMEDLDRLREVFGAQSDALLDCIAAACDQPREWVAGLRGGEGEALLVLWWSVNSDFFLQRVLFGVQLRLLRTVGTRDGRTSSPPSSKPATTPSGSGSTPGGS